MLLWTLSHKICDGLAQDPGVKAELTLFKPCFMTLRSTGWMWLFVGMKFEYNHAEIIVNAERQDKPPMINVITYEIEINSSDSKLNKDLLLRNIQKFGTIYNTLNVVCKISGDIKVVR